MQGSSAFLYQFCTQFCNLYLTTRTLQKCYCFDSARKKRGKHYLCISPFTTFENKIQNWKQLELQSNYLQYNVLKLSLLIFRQSDNESWDSYDRKGLQIAITIFIEYPKLFTELSIPILNFRQSDNELWDSYDRKGSRLRVRRLTLPLKAAKGN